MEFTESNWLSHLKFHTWFPLRRWLCVYFAFFPLLSGCELLDNVPCAPTYCETQVMVLKCSLLLVSTLDATSTIIATMAPTTPPSKAVGRLPALG